MSVCRIGSHITTRKSWHILCLYAPIDDSSTSNGLFLQVLCVDCSIVAASSGDDSCCCLALLLLSLRDTCFRSRVRLDASITGNFATADANRPPIACACRDVIILLVNSAVLPRI